MATYENMTRDQAERLARIEDGKQATVAAAYLVQPVFDMRELIINRLINMYRAGKVDHDLLVGRVAELSILDELTKRLENIQRQAEIAAMKEYGNG